jgi:SnoaL-like polyketide cyclase
MLLRGQLSARYAQPLVVGEGVLLQRQSKAFVGPPSGRQVELKGMTISRIEGGKIVEEWQSYANLSMMHQHLGLLPNSSRAGRQRVS